MNRNFTKNVVMKPKRILIHSVSCDGEGQLTYVVRIDGNIERLKTSYSANVVKYLDIDRSDAAVMGLLMFAIENQMDIESELPVSKTLYYKLIHHFIPGICTGNIYRPCIIAEVIHDVVSRGDICATGISCGIDSLYTIMEHEKNVTDEFHLNHVAFLNAGAHHFGSRELIDVLYTGRRDLAIQFSKYSRLPLIEISTNLPEVLEKYSYYNHVRYHTYMMLFCVLQIQSGISKYYYSGGYPYGMFMCGMSGHPDLACSRYDLLTLWTATNSCIEFYSTGGSLSRFDKVRALAGNEYSERFLNVCITSVKNCGQCIKCKRTLLELDAAGIINRYCAVFDVDTYKKQRVKFIKEGYRGAVKGDVYLKELMPFFYKELTWAERLIQRIRIFCGRVVSFIHPDSWKIVIKG
ncbi:MAG: hypothetical protein K2J00_08005 [Bacteroidaceae bacterium]|nr:hypothetical protein [Bacteroidaceae bacterium]